MLTLYMTGRSTVSPCRDGTGFSAVAGKYLYSFVDTFLFMWHKSDQSSGAASGTWGDTSLSLWKVPRPLDAPSFWLYSVLAGSGQRR